MELVARGHDRTGTQRHVPGGYAWPIVHPEHGVNRESIEEAILDHLARTPTALLRRLENADHPAREVTVPAQVVRSRQKHGRMPVVAAGVHLAWVGAGVGKRVFFSDG